MQDNEIFTMGSMFDGSGGFPLAGALSGFETRWASEIEKFPIELTSKRFPCMKHLGDICKIDGSKIEPVDVVTGGSPCFVGSTLVKTDKGLVPIKLIKSGDYVLTHNGRMRKVVETMVRGTLELFEMKAYGMPTLYTTRDHPFYTIRAYEHKPIWKKTISLEENDYIAMPIDFEAKQKNTFKLTLDECWLLGRFFATGSVENGCITFVDSKDLYPKYVEALVHTRIAEHDNSMNIKVLNVESSLPNFFELKINKKEIRFFKFCEEIYNNQINFELPMFIKKLPDKYLKMFLSGVFGVEVNSIKNSDLPNQYISSLDNKLVIEFQEIMCRLFHQVYECNSGSISGMKNFIFFNNMLWVRFEYAKIVNGNAKVYNLEVEEDHSYTVNGLAAHNCQDMSLAGKRKGMKLVCHKCGAEHTLTCEHSEHTLTCPECGELLEKTRSALFVEQMRVIKEMRKEQEKFGIPRENIKPRFLLWENVAGAFSSNQGEDFRQVLNEIISVVEGQGIDVPRPPKASKGKWNKAGVVMGDNWSIAWRQVDAQYWGVPQRRRRIYLVTDFGGQCAPEILFECESLSGNYQKSGVSWQKITRNFGKSIENTDTNDANQRIANEWYENLKKCHVNFNADYWNKNSNNGTAYGFHGWKSQLSDITFEKELSPCLCTAGTGNVLVTEEKKCFGMSSMHSNSMLSDNPNSGFFETNVARTLDMNGGNPTCNQGGVVVVEPMYCLQGSMIGRTNKNGPQGSGINENVSFTLNTVDHHAVATDCVRRFTPLECGRLQGFPDWWCSDVKHLDTPEYRMWGNGIALPNAYFVLRRIRAVLER